MPLLFAAIGWLIWRETGLPMDYFYAAGFAIVCYALGETQREVAELRKQLKKAQPRAGKDIPKDQIFDWADDLESYLRTTHHRSPSEFDADEKAALRNKVIRP